MLTRTLATLTLLLAFTAGTDPLAPAATHLDRVRTDVEGCREPAPAPVPVVPAACAGEGQP